MLYCVVHRLSGGSTPPHCRTAPASSFFSCLPAAQRWGGGLPLLPSVWLQAEAEAVRRGQRRLPLPAAASSSSSSSFAYITTLARPINKLNSDSVPCGRGAGPSPATAIHGGGLPAAGPRLPHWPPLPGDRGGSGAPLGHPQLHASPIGLGDHAAATTTRRPPDAAAV